MRPEPAHNKYTMAAPGDVQAPRRYRAGVLVLLPPSETKRDGGDGPPLRLARAGLGLSTQQHAEVARNAELWTSPTVPALHRYTGVLYDALDVGSLRGATAVRARRRLVVGSALFGLLTADDPVPAYRLSAASALPGRGTLAAAWRPVLEPLLAAVAARELVVDLRSGSYAALARVPGAVTVTVRTAGGAIVSHFNKAHKGRLARVLVSSRAEPTDAAGVAAVARRAGLHVDRRGQALTVVLPPV